MPSIEKVEESARIVVHLEENGYVSVTPVGEDCTPDNTPIVAESRENRESGYIDPVFRQGLRDALDSAVDTVLHALVNYRSWEDYIGD